MNHLLKLNLFIVMIYLSCFVQKGLNQIMVFFVSIFLPHGFQNVLNIIPVVDITNPKFLHIVWILPFCFDKFQPNVFLMWLMIIFWMLFLAKYKIANILAQPNFLAMYQLYIFKVVINSFFWAFRYALLSSME